MRDYLTAFLRRTPAAASLGECAECATPEQLPELTKPLPAQPQTGSVSFDSALTLTQTESPRAQPMAATEPQEGRTRGAWLRRLGVRRLPLWSVCRSVSRTVAETDLLFASLALADGLPEQHLIEE